MGCLFFLGSECHLSPAWDRHSLTCLVADSYFVFMELPKKDKKYFNIWKLIFAILFLLLPTFIFVKYHSQIFFHFSDFTWHDYLYRFVGCLCASSLGFSFLIFHCLCGSLKEKRFPYGYIYDFPVKIVIITSIIFAIFQSFEQTNGLSFYFFSFPCCFIGAFFSDHLYDKVYQYIEKITK